MSAKDAVLPFKPYEHQRAAHASRSAARFLVLVWHRRAGKTVFAILELLLAAATCERQKGRYAYIAPLLKQAKAVAWDYLTFYARFIPGTVINEGELSVDLPNGAQVRLYGADNPDGLRGIYLDGTVLDEVADMKANVWGEIIRPALTDRLGWAIFIGTPKGVNLFSDLYFEAAKRPEGWGADLRRATDTGIIPPDELERNRREMTPAQFAQEFDCDFSAASADSLIPLDIAIAASKRVLHESAFDYAPRVLGVDVARYGDDATAIVRRQGLASFAPKTFRGLSAVEVASQVSKEIEEWKPAAIFIDSTGGYGAGPIDILASHGHPVSGIEFAGKPTNPRFENKRVEMWSDMADWLKAGGRIPSEPSLIRELTTPRYTYRNAHGKMQLESKDQIRARRLPSPDQADALALTFAQFVPVTTPLEEVRNRHEPTSFDYDPYAERV